MTTMGANAFVDTNVLLRSIHVNALLHQESDALIAQMRENGYTLWISRQVLREYLVQVMRPGILRQSLTVKQVKARLKTMRLVFTIADDTDAVTEKLIELLERFPSGGKQIHDVNIVATMLVNQIDTLLTLNLAHMERFGSEIKIIAPSMPHQNGNHENE